VAESVIYSKAGNAYTGIVMVNNGNIEEGISLSGKSLIHSVDLTMEAFTRGYLGEYGRYIVSVGLILFAFSTAVAWSYYGDRAMTYLFGVKSVFAYRVVYILGFFVAAVVDTTLVWLFSAITIAFMTLPNLFSMLMLRKEMKQDIEDYWLRFDQAFPKKRVKTEKEEK